MGWLQLQNNTQSEAIQFVNIQMSVDYEEGDLVVLGHIIEHANQRYLRESRVHKGSSFNILRILSAFKETCGQYPLRRDHIYNLIIYITKNYNPCRYNQWLEAIAKAQRQPLGTNNSTHRNYGHAHDPHINRTMNQLSRKCEDFSSQAHNQSQMQARLGGGHKWGQALCSDSRSRLLAPISSKMHYISFEPEHQNKENVNSANTKGEQVKPDPLLDNQPTRTPGEQSFIHYLPMSSGSPFVLSKITNNTKEVTELELDHDEEEHNDEWVSMKARADIFYAINLKFKSLSALLANFQAFQSCHHIFIKTKQYQKRLSFARFYSAAKLLCSRARHQAKVTKIAVNNYEQNLKRKTYKILSAFYELKIDSKKSKTICMERLSSVGYQFIISLIFSSWGWEERVGMGGQQDTPKSIRHKSRHFQSVEDCQKMGIISEYFGSNLKLTRQQIHGLFQLQRKARKQQVWAILKANMRSFNFESKQLILVRRRNRFANMLRSYRKRLVRKGRIKSMSICSQARLKQKCFCILFQLLLSKKVYLKREQFLRNQHQLKVMRAMIGRWRRAREAQQMIKMDRKTRLQRMAALIIRTIVKKYFGHFTQACEIQKMRLISEQQSRNQAIVEKVFQFLSCRVRERRLHEQIRMGRGHRIKQEALKKWIKCVKLCLAVAKATTIYAKVVFDALKYESQIIGKSEHTVRWLSSQRAGNALRQFQACHTLQQSVLQDRTRTIIKMALGQQLKVLFRICKAQIKMRELLKRNQELKAKIQMWEEWRKKSKRSLLVKTLKWKHQWRTSQLRKQKIMKSVMGDRRIPLLNGRSYQTYTPCLARLKKDAMCWWRGWAQINHKITKIKANASKFWIGWVAGSIASWRSRTAFKKASDRTQLGKQKQSKMIVLRVLQQWLAHSEGQMGKAAQHHCRKLKLKSMSSWGETTAAYKGTVSILTHSVLQCRKADQGRKLVSLLRSDLSLKKNEGKLAKMLFVKKLSLCCRNQRRKAGKVRDLKNQIKKHCLNKFTDLRSMKEERKLRARSGVEAMKRLAIWRVNMSVARQILRKKKAYMAIKFKAIYLCRLGFRSLLNNRWPEAQNLAQSKKFRVHEHISTSYSQL